MSGGVTDRTTVTFRMGRLRPGVKEGTSYRKVFAYMFSRKRGVYVGNAITKPEGNLRFLSEVGWTHTLLEMEGKYYDTPNDLKKDIREPLEELQRGLDEIFRVGLRNV